MSLFEIEGTVKEVQKLTSAKGNPFLKFLLSETAQKTFELSIAGYLMNQAPLVTKGAVIKVNGELFSREYQDKNGTTRYGIDLRVSNITPVGAPTKATDSNVMDLPF